MEISGAVCVLAKSKEGFWMADIYLEGWAEGISPDWYCTGKKGGTKKELMDKVLKTYPDINMVPGYIEE